jgi:hypothetical protein
MATVPNRANSSARKVDPMQEFLDRTSLKYATTGNLPDSTPAQQGNTTPPKDTFPSFQEVTDHKRFHAALSTAASANTHGAAVTVNPAAHYKTHRMFLTPDNSAGYAVSPEGEIVSGFKHPASPYKNVGKHIIEHATLVTGATHLNAYDTVLPHLYAQAQFKAVSRIPWNEEYKPEGWNPNDGTPDVVFMSRNITGSAKPYKKTQGKVGEDYDEELAKAAQVGARSKSKREQEVQKLRDAAGLKEGQYSTKNRKGAK